MAGLHGNIQGVGGDLVNYLTAVAEHFKITINVTSGYRDTSQQAEAMLKYWIKLKRGKVYAKKNLSEVDRKKLDDFYQICKGNPKAKLKDRQEAKASFLKLATDQQEGRSRHCTGRAVDVTQASVPPAAYRAITQRLQEVMEGRKDIYHFECETIVPPATSADVKSWDKLSTAPLALTSRDRTCPVGVDIACFCTV